MNVLSLFDGMSCGMIALERSGIKVDNYLASEIDKYAQIVSKANFPKTVYIGDVRNIDTDALPFIDLLIGGSPCQSFSFAGKRKGMSTFDNVEILTLEYYLELKAQGFQFQGQSYLFWEYIRILKAVRARNPNVKFLLENVMMLERWQTIITRAIEINPIEINSSLLSAQNRARLYWTNIGAKPAGLFDELYCQIPKPNDRGLFVKDIVQEEVDSKYFISEKMLLWFEKHSKKNKEKGNGFGFELLNQNGKSHALNARYYKIGIDDNYIIHSTMARSGNPNEGGTGHLTRNDGKTYCLDAGASIMIENKGEPIRRFTPIECERLQTVPDNYTNHVSDTQRYKMLGNGWTIDVIAHIFSYLK